LFLFLKATFLYNTSEALSRRTYHVLVGDFTAYAKWCIEGETQACGLDSVNILSTLASPSAGLCKGTA